MSVFEHLSRQKHSMQATVDKIAGFKRKLLVLEDHELQAKTGELRRRLAAGETLDQLLPEAYAVVREAARRVLGMEPYPVQLMGAVALHQGHIAEMRTGEGKTLAATLPAYLNALADKGVHVVTVNDYLAKRDAEEMGKLYTFLGLTVGAVLGGMERGERKEAYACDITYVTNHELGFDYLRDNMVLSRDQAVQRGLHYAIIDEVDSVLIDDARTPLIISGTANRAVKLYEACNILAKRMTEGQVIAGSGRRGAEAETGDFILQEQEKQVTLTAAGIRKVEQFFRIGNISDPQNGEIQRYMDLALRANYLLQRDRDYVVMNGQVLIVDQGTGRIAEGRRYSDGLHQAVEAKEGVWIRQESRTVATITYQNFFNKYEKKAGMTGTAQAQAEEFLAVYGMDIVTIPTNRPVIRQDREDLIFRTRQEKLDAVCDTVMVSRARTRPVLVGTVSVSASEELSRLLSDRGVPHTVLNAKFHEQEAAIVAEAGKKGAVTIATNMAGRGTDIKLDDAARLAGGLLVIGTERHDSRRVDDQLRGRSGRQGDPGESRFYLSLEDDLLRLSGLQKLDAMYDTLQVRKGQGVTDPALTRVVEQAQLKREGDHFNQRRRLLEYDQVLNEQREIMYAQRLQVLTEPDVDKVVLKILEDVAQEVASTVHLYESRKEWWDVASQAVAGLMSTTALWACQDCPEGELADRLMEGFRERLEFIEHAFSDQVTLHDRERSILLRTVDLRWMEHIDDLEQLRQGIGLVRYAKRDPLVEYRKSAFQLFEEMNRNIRLDTAAALLGTEAEVR